MIVAIHQPNFIPWIGYFYKILKADLFVMLDDAQYSKNSFINRNKIKTPQGEQWLTLPVIQSGKFGQPINQVELFNPGISMAKIKSSIRANYVKAPHFDEVFPIVDKQMNDPQNLVTLNEKLIRAISSYLGLKTTILKSSDLNSVTGQSTERLVKICEELSATTYLAGFGSNNYQDSEPFAAEGITCQVYNFVHPTYSQLWGEFVPNLSIIDLLFNHGREALNYLNSTNETSEV